MRQTIIRIFWNFQITPKPLVTDTNNLTSVKRKFDTAADDVRTNIVFQLEKFIELVNIGIYKQNFK